MQKQAAQPAALANRPITIVASPPPSHCQFAGVLDHNDVTPCNPRCSAFHRMANHLCGGHALIAQETREPHFLGALTGQSSDAGAGPLNQGGVKVGPPFSRRRSPNRPSPNGIAMATSANQHLLHGISWATVRQPRCVHTIAVIGRGREWPLGCYVTLNNEDARPPAQG